MADEGAGPAEHREAPTQPPPTRLSVASRRSRRSRQAVDEHDEEFVGPKDDGPWLQVLKREFGWQLLSFIMASQHMFKGFVRGLMTSNWNYIIREYDVPATRITIYEGVVQLPWALKPVIGFMSDYFPIFGHSKLPYLLVSTLMGTTALTILAYYRRDLSIDSVVSLLFYVFLAQSTVDLLTEAVYAKALREKPPYGPSLTSFVWGGMIFAGIFATLISGMILSYSSPWLVYSVSAWPSGLMIIPVLQNWIMESPMTDAQVQAQRHNVLKQSESLVLALIMLCSCVALSYSGMMLSVRMNALVNLLVLLFVVFSFSLMLNPIIAKVNAFGLIQTAMNVSLGSAAFFFMMDTSKEYPDGPHFSVPFCSIVLPLVGSFFSIVGIWLYNMHAGLWTYQKMFIIGNLVVLVTSLADVVFFLRINKRIGIEDHIFVLGSASFQSVIEEWLWMPNVLLLGQLCPRGLEAIMYANLAGCHNLGNTISNSLGALLLDLCHVAPTGVRLETHEFDNLWLASLISTMLPLLPVALVPWFIPNKLNTQPILENPAMSINDGSLLRQWLGRTNEDSGVSDSDHHS